MQRVKVIVSAPAHLHAGNFELSYSYGRILGTVGITIAWPRTTIVAWKCGKSRVEGPYSDTVHEFLEHLEARNICIHVLEAVSRGVGLGGTTSLALSVAVAVEALKGPIGLEKVVSLAARLGRAKWSGLGLYSFLYGGFIVDGGRWGEEKPRIIARHPIPHHWRVVTVLFEDHVEMIRALKRGEDSVLEKLPQAPESFSSQLAHMILAGALPCLVEERVKCFVKALFDYNSRLGDYWARLGQRGRYCCSEAEELVNYFLNKGYYFIQSSWGPTLWTIVGSEVEAFKLYKQVSDWSRARGIRVWSWITQPDNHGATITPGHLSLWRSMYG